MVTIATSGIGILNFQTLNVNIKNFMIFYLQLLFANVCDLDKFFKRFNLTHVTLVDSTAIAAVFKLDVL